jgi:uncharacterized protein
MSAQTITASTYVDSLRFARSGETLAGEYLVSDMSRLCDMLASDDGVIRFQLSGSMAAGRPTLQLELATDLNMVCQRCLETYTQSVHGESIMPIARDERELARWEREDPLIDAQIADPRLDVRNLVEDEILLSLPLMPRHAEGECSLGYKCSPGDKSSPAVD